MTLDDCFCQHFIDFFMPRYGFACTAVCVDIMIGAVSQKISAVCFQQLNQISAFHSVIPSLVYYTYSVRICQGIA